MRDAEVACLLLQAEVATMIPKKFLSGASLTSLDLSAVSVVTLIEDSFLHQCTMLTNVDLSGLIHVMQIGHSFLYGCSALCKLEGTKT